MASGFLVSSTEPASARYSRLRDSAKRITIDSSQATAISTTAMMIAIAAPPPLRSLLPLLRQRKPPWNISRNTSSAKNEITPAMITAITSMRTSPLRIWVSSWPSTASSSASSSRSTRAGGHGDRVLLLVHPGGEGVERVVLHHLELRHRDAARDAEVLQQIVEPRLLLPGHLASAGDRVDHRLVEVVGDENPQRRADGHERQRVEEVAATPRAR